MFRDNAAMTTPVDEIDRLRREVEALRAREAAHRAEMEAVRAEAERATRAKSRFLAAASHDLRQPFQAMRLFLHLLEARLTDKGQLELAGRLEEALTSSESLLNALLEVSALEAATVKPSPVRLPVGDVLRRLAEQFAPEAAEKGLDLRMVPSSAEVVSDPVLLDRILRNLVVNALRYTERGRLLLGCRRRGGWLAIEVCDTGVGIPADKQRQIFEEFVQLQDRPKSRQQGLGLGLAIVARTAQLLGHTIEVASVPGRGSRFALLVPLAGAGAARSVPDAMAEAGAGDGILVALLEDDPLQLAAMEHMLGDWGCIPVAAYRPDELMDALRRLGRAPDVVVSDYRLSGGASGTDVIRRVREEFGAQVGGLLVTGDTHQELQEEAARDGYKVVHKPIHPKRLRAAIEAASGRTAAG